ncbi:hypothetical protein ACFL60_07350 [Candidatus Omnitrophota bacterium]
MSFEKIIGQRSAVEAIRNMIKGDRLRGTYLFLGPDGVGKRTTAIEFSKAVNCEVDDHDACGKCESCKKIDSSNHPDIFSIFPEENSRYKTSRGHVKCGIKDLCIFWRGLL